MHGPDIGNSVDSLQGCKVALLLLCFSNCGLASRFTIGGVQFNGKSGMQGQQTSNLTSNSTTSLTMASVTRPRVLAKLLLALLVQHPAIAFRLNSLGQQSPAFGKGSFGHPLFDQHAVRQSWSMSADVESEGENSPQSLGVFDDEQGRLFLTKPEVREFLFGPYLSQRRLKILKDHQADEKPEQSNRFAGATNSRKTLVLDLDDTLICTAVNLPGPGEQQPEILLEKHLKGLEGWEWEKESSTGVYVFKRPGLDRFLREVALLYNLVIYTAASPLHADPILDALESTIPNPLCASQRLFSRRLNSANMSGYSKDLKKLGEPLQDVVMIDDRPTSIMQPKNTIPIRYWSKVRFQDSKPDQELMDLIPILQKLAVVDDVRYMWPQVIQRESGS